MRTKTTERDVQDVAERLRQAGLKLTAQRLAVVSCLVGDETHPTAQELFDRLRPAFPSMSFATVYNTLAALSGVGACNTVQLGGAARFDPNVNAHDHLVCDTCGMVRDVPTPDAVTPAKPARRDLAGFEVHHVERIYRGLCASCRKIG